ncbi:DUF1566 domain-containing protein [bacterium]|nr:DUF1566 domain-containing protein [bacterium]
MKTTVFLLLSFACLHLGFAAVPSDALAGIVDNDDGTVTDTESGLIWTKRSNGSRSISFFDAAIYYVGELETAGYAWRMPTQVELDSLYDTEFAWSTEACPDDTLHISPVFDIVCGDFWGDSNAWYYSFRDGQTYSDSRGLDDGNEVLAVAMMTDDDDDTTDDDTTPDDDTDDDDDGGGFGCRGRDLPR